MKKRILFMSALALSAITFAQTGVGVMTQNPQGTFHVDAAGDNATTGTPTSAQQVNDFIVTNTGNVGIGTASPTDKLVVTGVGGGINDASVRVRSILQSTSDDAGTIFRIGSGSSAYGYLLAFGSNYLYGDAAYDNISYYKKNTVALATSILTDELNIASPKSTGIINFYTGGDKDTNIRMLIDSNGNVGIGNTPSTGTKLRVKSFGTNSWPLWMDSSTGRFAGFYEEAGAEAGQLRLYIHDGTDYAVNIASRGDSWINSGSNLGIGTKNPKTKLDVTGYVKLGSTDVAADADTAANREGAIRYTAANGLQYHDASNWVSVAGTSGSLAADTTVDAWVNDATNTMVKLGSKSDGSTARDVGTEFVVTDDGNTGIGTLPSSGTKLRVKSKLTNSWPIWVDSSTGMFGGIYEEGGANAGHLRLYINDGAKYAINFSAKGNSWINSGGNFGIENNNPTYKLDVINSTNAFRFLNGTGANERLQTSIDSNGVNMAVMNSSGNGIPFIFTGGTTERMRINNDGKVGISNNAPNYQLDVVSSTNAFRFLNETGANERLQTSIDSNGVNMTVTNTTGAGIPFIFTGGSMERMRINSNGNVGIGTTAPAERLEVDGAIIIGNSSVANTCTKAGEIYWNGTNFMGCTTASGAGVQLNN